MLPSVPSHHHDRHTTIIIAGMAEPRPSSFLLPLSLRRTHTHDMAPTSSYQIRRPLSRIGHRVGLRGREGCWRCGGEEKMVVSAQIGRGSNARSTACPRIWHYSKRGGEDGGGGSCPFHSGSRMCQRRGWDRRIRRPRPPRWQIRWPDWGERRRWCAGGERRVRRRHT